MAEENVDVMEEATTEGETPVDTPEPTTEQSLDSHLDSLWEQNQDADSKPDDNVEETEDVEAADEGNVEEEAEPKKVVLTRREKEALKHADMEEAVEGMDPSAVKKLAKKLAEERSAKDKLASEKGKLQEQLEAKEKAEEDQFDIDSEENEWLPDEAKDAFKKVQEQLRATQERLESLEQRANDTTERFWDKIDAKKYPQYSKGEDVEELRSEIEADADIAMGINPALTRPEALAKCLELATSEDQIKARVQKEVAKRTRKKRGSPTPKMSGGQRLPATGTETLDEHLDALYDKLRTV